MHLQTAYKTPLKEKDQILHPLWFTIALLNILFSQALETQFVNLKTLKLNSCSLFSSSLLHNIHHTYHKLCDWMWFIPNFSQFTHTNSSLWMFLTTSASRRFNTFEKLRVVWIRSDFWIQNNSSSYRVCSLNANRASFFHSVYSGSVRVTKSV